MTWASDADSSTASASSTSGVESTSGRSPSEQPLSSDPTTPLTPPSGGHFAPEIASLIQNTRFPDWPKSRVKVDSVGIINGIIDTLIQTPSYPDFAVNNTYGIQTTPVAVAETAKDNMSTCAYLTTLCRGLQNQYDPLNTGLNSTIKAACLDAFGYCITFVAGPYDALSGVCLLPPSTPTIP